MSARAEVVAPILSRAARWPVWLILAAAVSLHLADLNHPFIARHDFATAHEAILARSHVRYGLSDTLTRPTFPRYSAAPSDARKLYPDHPPLTDLLIAASLATFGERDWAVRLIPAFATVAMILLVMSIVRPIAGPRVALLAGAAGVILPILVYFGRIACHEPPTLALWVAALRGYFGWSYPALYGNRRRRDGAIFAGATLLSLLCGWVAFIQAAVVAVHHFIETLRRRRPWSWSGAALVLLPAAIGATLTATHIVWMMDWNLRHLFEVFRFRTALKQSEKAFTTADWLLRQAKWVRQNFGLIGVALSLFGLIGWRRRGIGDRPANSCAVLVALCGTAGMHFVLIFRSGSFEHEYWWLHVVPAAMVLIALGVDRLMTLAARLSGKLAAITPGVLLLLAAENLSFNEEYRHTRRIIAHALPACQWLRVRTLPDEQIAGNRDYWIRRDYFEGPMRFMQPQVAWYLDRNYVRAVSRESIRAAAGNCRYYLWVPIDKSDLATLKLLPEFAKLRAEWPRAKVFEFVPPTRPDVILLNGTRPTTAQGATPTAP